MATKSPKSIIGMAMARTATQPANSYLPLKQGKYPMTIARAVWKPTKRGDGHILSLGLKTETGRWVFENLNLDNPSAISMEIAAKNFANLLGALHLSAEQFQTEEDFEALIGHEVIAALGIDKAGDNKVRWYESV